MKTVRWLLVGALACLLLDGCAPPPQQFLDESLRNSADGREAAIVVAQTGIKADINPSNIRQYFGAPVVWIIDAEITKNRTENAQKQLAAVHDTAVAYDFDRHAREATDAMVKRLPWLDIRKTIFNKDASDNSLAGILDNAKSSQVLVAQYDYAMGPDYSSVKTILTVGIYPKAGAPGTMAKDRVSPSKAYYFQRFVAYEYRPDDPDYRPDDPKDLDRNSDYWTADNGAAMAAALNKGLANVGDLFVRSMAAKIDIDTLNKTRNIHIYDTDGHLVESADHRYLLYNVALSTWHFIDGRPLPPE